MNNVILGTPLPSEEGQFKEIKVKGTPEKRVKRVIKTCRKALFSELTLDI